MICIKPINGLSNENWDSTQIQVNKPKIFFLSRKTKKASHPLSRFNNNIVPQIPYQNHLGIFLDAWLAFEEHLKIITTKVNKRLYRTVGL